jgi:predicted helicase
MVSFYTTEMKRFHEAYSGLDRRALESRVDGFINTDPTKISWTHNLKLDLLRNRRLDINPSQISTSLYRPFTKMWLYYDRRLNERVYQMPKIFPISESRENIMITTTANGASQFSTYIVTCVIDLNSMSAGAQCLPLYLYDVTDEEDNVTGSQQPELGLDTPIEAARTGRRDAITDEALNHFQSVYSGEEISREDIFYYIYGLFHSEDYRQRYADNLTKELPRIPRVKSSEDFWAFSRAGRELAELHINYESVDMFPAKVDISGSPVSYRVEKMKFGGRGKQKDQTTIIYNNQITVSEIPVEAYDYVVNGKSAIDWVMEWQAVKTHKASGIVNDANDWATETMNNPKYPLELLLRVITVSVKTLKIVRSLPSLEIHKLDLA